MYGAEPLHIETFGRFVVTHNGREVPLSRAKDRALLAFLVVNKPRSYTRDFLADLLWSNVDLERARHSLNQAIYSIRRVLPHVLEAYRTQIRCKDQAITVDVETIRNRVAQGDVLSVVRELKGDFLSDVAVAHAPVFETWKTDYGRNLNLELNQALSHQLRQLRPNDRSYEIAKLPFHCRDHFPAIQDAIKLNASASTLVDERLEESDGSTEPQPILIGRHPQLAVLANAWRRARNSEPQFVAVVGNAGYGKTTLINHFAAIVKRDGRVLQSTCYEAERTIALAPAIQVLKSTFAADEIASLDPIWAAAINKFITPSSEDPDLPPLSDDAAQIRLFEAILQALMHLAASQPTLVIFDDVHWVDNTTRALLSYLSHNALPSRLMVVITFRTEPQSGRIAPPWDRWLSVGLGDFVANELEEIVKTFYLAVDQAELLSPERLRRLTDGHPYLVFEVLRSVGRHELVGTTRQSVEYYVQQSLEELPLGQQRVVAALAVIGKPCSLELLRKVTRLHGATTAVEHLVNRQILKSSKARVRFRHDLLREAAYKRIPPLTRVDLHRRTAKVLARSRHEDGEAAVQYCKAGAYKHALEHARKALMQADKRGALEDAIYYLKLALRCRPEDEIRLRRTLAVRLAGAHRFTEARKQVHLVLGSSPHLESHELDDLHVFDCELALVLAAMPREEIHARLGQIVKNCGNSHIVSRALRLQLRLAIMHGTETEVRSGIGRLRMFGLEKIEEPEGIACLAAAVRGQALFYSAIEAHQWATPLWIRSDVLEDPELRHKTWAVLGDLAYQCGDLLKSEAVQRRSLRDIEAVGAMSALPLATTHLYMVLIEQGRYVEASTLAAKLRQRRGALLDVQTTIALSANEASMYYDVGKLEEARSSAEAALIHLNEFPIVWVRIAVLGLLGKISLDLGSISKATAYAEEGGQLLSAVGMRASDISDMEILLARLASISQSRDAGINRLTDAINDYRERDVVCRLKMQLELARLLKRIDNKQARQHANEVFTTASAINARPLADRADSLLHRL